MLEHFTILSAKLDQPENRVTKRQVFESPVPGIIQQNLEASFGVKPADDDADNFLSSLEPLPGILAPVARSDLTEYEDDYLEEPQGPSYAYGALRLRELVTEWREQQEEVSPSRGGEQGGQQGPSYAYGALGSRFQTDAVVVDIYSNFPEPKQTSYN